MFPGDPRRKLRDAGLRVDHIFDPKDHICFYRGFHWRKFYQDHLREYELACYYHDGYMQLIVWIAPSQYPVSVKIYSEPSPVLGHRRPVVTESVETDPRKAFIGPLPRNVYYRLSHLEIADLFIAAHQLVVSSKSSLSLFSAFQQVDAEFDYDELRRQIADERHASGLSNSNLRFPPRYMGGLEDFTAPSGL